jgi:6,7-dimethyl-8-ribityllumazine synthase
MFAIFFAMSLDRPDMTSIDGAGLRFAIVAARFNQRLVDDLLDNILRVLDDAGVAPEDVETIRVPGSHEIPYVAGMLAKGGEFDSIICLGVVIAGETPHHDIIAHGTAAALLRIGNDTEIPLINGIIVTNTLAQAQARCSGRINRGREFAQAALEMADLKRRLVHRLDQLEANRDAGQEHGQQNDFWSNYPEDDEGESWKL